mmetsp:Transcript_4057/g.5274  ORF Transcript_4057/g.5274 Transcript_4057/m.5274 type:complete len:156 (+) Transcript_4057:69-536(+)
MRGIIQRVLSGSVTLQPQGDVVAKIDRGLVVLVGLSTEDKEEDAQWLAKKLTNIRLWPEDGKQWMHSINNLNYQILLVSNFTLMGYMKGNRPDYHLAMEPKKAEELYNRFVDLVKESIHDKDAVSSGVFGADMEVKASNDGPVTIILDSKNRGGR